jgi:hypothetical protein
MCFGMLWRTNGFVGDRDEMSSISVWVRCEAARYHADVVLNGIAVGRRYRVVNPGSPAEQQESFLALGKEATSSVRSASELVAN